MKTLIKEEIINNHDYKELAKVVGFTSVSSLYKFLAEENRELEFEKLVRLINEVFPNDDSMLREFVLTLKKSNNIRAALHYYYKLNDTEMIFKLIQNLNLNNHEDKQYYGFYELYVMLKKDHITDTEFLSGIIYNSFTSPELNSMIVEIIENM